MDVSGAAGLFVNRIARREIAPVRMTGNYGGQILRRLVSFEASDFGESLFNAEFIPHLRGAASVYAAERRDDRLSFIAFKQMPWLHYARYALEQSQLPIRSPYLDNDLVALAFQAPTDLATNRKLAARLIADGNPALAAFPTDRGPLGRPGVLGKIRERCQEFMFKAEYAYDYGMPQWLTQIDRALTPLHVERLFLGRHKYCHYRLWYRRQLAPFVREVLLDSQALGRTYLNRQRVEKIVRAHVTGRGNYTTELHALLTSELMQRQLIAQN
jgi:asparagine synthase (glutamine-hydrolysing)